MANVRWVAAAALAALAAPAIIHAQGRPKQIYIRVTDAGGAPVAGLAASDFDVREGGAPRTVTGAAPASSVMRIALLVDNGPLVGPIIKDLRAALAAFFDEVPPRHEILFATLGRRFEVRVPVTDDYTKLKKSADILLAERDGGTYLLEGVVEADDRYFRKAIDRRPVMVIVTTDNADPSRLRQEVLNRRFNEIYDRGVLVHAVVITHPGEDGNERDVCINLTQSTNGHLDIVSATGAALPDKLKGIAARLAESHRQMSAEYRIAFLSEASTPQPIEIKVSRPGVKIEFSAQRSRN